MTNRILATIDEVYQHICSNYAILRDGDSTLYWKGAVECITVVRQKVQKIVEEDLTQPVELKLFVPTEEYYAGCEYVR